MKVLFVGSNPTDAGDLAFERDITSLEKRMMHVTGIDVRFIFLPSISLEELPQALSDIRPDVLHIASHGEDDRLVLSDLRGNRRPVTAAVVRALVDPLCPPALVYLSACDSASIAIELAKQGLCAIGATAAISNAAARAATVCFYDRMVRGFTVGQAHQAAQAVLSAMNGVEVHAVLHEPVTGQLASRHMVRVPRIVAEPTKPPKRLKNGTVEVELRVGVMDYPEETSRIAFFTPDRSFGAHGVEAEYTDDWVGDVCWCEGWLANGDFLVVATGTSRTKRTFCEATRATQALLDCIYYKPVQRQATDNLVRLAVRALQGHPPVPPSTTSVVAVPATTRPRSQPAKQAIKLKPASKRAPKLPARPKHKQKK